MRVRLLGPPGAGKVTQRRSSPFQLGVPAILDRRHLPGQRQRQTELGQQPRPTWTPATWSRQITVAMVKDRLAEPDASRLPARRLPPHHLPGRAARPSLAELGNASTAARAGVDEDELVRRLSGRRMLVDGEMVQRDDDRPETVRHRLDVYREQTSPLSRVLRVQGLLSDRPRSAVEEVTAPRDVRAGCGDPEQPTEGWRACCDDGRDPEPPPLLAKWSGRMIQSRRRRRSSSCGAPARRRRGDRRPPRRVRRGVTTG